jgi:hypothetical protein
MKKVQFEIDPHTLASVQKFLATTRGSDNTSTHGPLTAPKLAKMLLEDVALVVERPGCWEADSMFSLLAGHGYEY